MLTISSAKIKWGTSAGIYPNEVTMSNSGDTYSGIITKQIGGTTVYFVIEATDDELETTTSTENNYNVSISDGIEKITSDNLNIYPNPTAGKVNVELTEKMILESIQVFNLIGEKVLEYTNLNSYHFSIDLGQFPKGFYIIQVDGSNSKAVRKIMLK